MPDSTSLLSKYQKASLLNETLQAEQARFETRYQDIVARYYQAQAAHQMAVQQCTHFQTVARIKQEVIAVLLPYHPHFLTPELQRRINLC
ncbi:MAG: hypothetical protein ACRYFK_13415 [Janthinobacterium lividum]